MCTLWKGKGFILKKQPAILRLQAVVEFYLDDDQ